MTDNASSPRFTPLGKFVSLLLIIGLVAFGVYLVRRNQSGGADAADKADAAGTPEVVDVQVEVPKLSPPGAVTIKDNIVPIEISEYAGYAGLIAANGGLEPNENSVFFKNGGFKVKLTVSED